LKPQREGVGKYINLNKHKFDDDNEANKTKKTKTINSSFGDFSSW
jgi:hypothetical protein